MIPPMDNKRRIIYNFECKCCGDCCSGSMDIYINLYDLYKIGKYFKLKSSNELFKKNIIKLTPGQNGLKLPKINFKNRVYMFCPFIINDLDKNNNLKGFCSLHPFNKPLVCILAPTSRTYDPSTNLSEYSFTKPTESCPGIIKEDQLISPSKELKKEIQYEERYYKILDRVLKLNIDGYENDLYNFNLNTPFNEILYRVEELYKI